MQEVGGPRHIGEGKKKGDEETHPREHTPNGGAEANPAHPLSVYVPKEEESNATASIKRTQGGSKKGREGDVKVRNAMAVRYKKQNGDFRVFKVAHERLGCSIRNQPDNVLKMCLRGKTKGEKEGKIAKKDILREEPTGKE